MLAPQLDDWGQPSAERAIELVEHFAVNCNVDSSRVFIEGYSGGGETLSLAMGMRPELFAAALAVSSKWDGDLNALVEARTPLRLFTGREDSYYGSARSSRPQKGSASYIGKAARAGRKLIRLSCSIFSATASMAALSLTSATT